MGPIITRHAMTAAELAAMLNDACTGHSLQKLARQWLTTHKWDGLRVNKNHVSIFRDGRVISHLKKTLIRTADGHRLLPIEQNRSVICGQCFLEVSAREATLNTHEACGSTLSVEPCLQHRPAYVTAA